MCYIRSDQGTNFTGGKLLEILNKEKIEPKFAPPYTAELNGTSVRFNRIIQRKIRALMFDSGLPKSMWELALDAAVYIYNRSQHKTLEFNAPLKLFNPKRKDH